MDMECVRRRSSIAPATALLLFLTTLAVLTASASASGGGDAAPAAEQSQHCHPLDPHPNPPLAADEPYALIVFQNSKDGGEEIRVLADQRPSVPRGGYSYANRSGNWFYSIRERDRDEEDGNSKRRRRLLLPAQRSNAAAEGLWHSLGSLANTTAAAAAADGGDGEQYYMVVGLQTSGGDKIRLLVVADERQRLMFITGFARGFLIRPRWFFREGELLPLPSSLGGGGGSRSHAEVVASSLLAALKKMSEEEETA